MSSPKSLAKTIMAEPNDSLSNQQMSTNEDQSNASAHCHHGDTTQRVAISDSQPLLPIDEEKSVVHDLQNRIIPERRSISPVPGMKENGGAPVCVSEKTSKTSNGSPSQEADSLEEASKPTIHETVKLPDASPGCADSLQHVTHRKPESQGDQTATKTTDVSTRRSERKAKAFARVRLVLAHEQIIDDDNFLGFTNRKTYIPPKKRKKLCQFKGDQPVKPQLPKASILKKKKKKKKGTDKPKIKNTKIPKSERQKDITLKEETELAEETAVVSSAEETVSQEHAELVEEVKHQPRKLQWFTCEYCHYKTTNKYYIKRHEMIHDRPKISYECHYCDYVTKSIIRHKEHEAKHTQEKPFKCQHCDYCSRSYTDFRRHQAKHASEKKYKCPHCDFATKWSRNVSHHILKHTTARPHKCHICGFSFKRIQDLKYHLYRHNDLKPISCDRCDFKCKTNYELRCHKLKHSDERFFACTHPGCTQRTKTKSDLTKHMNIHNLDKKFICGVCQKGFNAKSTLAKHVQIHGERVLLKCDICQKCLKTRASLQGHLKLHQGHYPFSCDICHRRFAVKWNMIKHQETHRLGDRPYRCPICPYGARTMEHLLTHIGSMHGKSYAYFCEFCRKPFKRYGQLKIHLKRMHSTSLNQTSPEAMESMLKEVKPIKTELKQDGLSSLEQSSIELVEVKQEPLDQLCNSVAPLVACESDRPSSSDGSTGKQVQEMISANFEAEQDILEIGSSNIKTENSGITALEENPVATVGIYNGFTLPLATKGFEFNLEKRGKKPDSWFMDLNNMHTEAADKHKKYLYKKQQGLLPTHQPKLPTDKKEREAEKRRRKLEKYVISCRVSSKSDTTLIFQTEKQKKKTSSKTSSAKSNTVAAILERSEAKRNITSSASDSIIAKSENDKQPPKQKVKKKKKQIKINAKRASSNSVTKLITDDDLVKSNDTQRTVSPKAVPQLKEEQKPTYSCPSGNSVSSDIASISCLALNSTDKFPVKRKRGRPKGSKNKKTRVVSRPAKGSKTKRKTGTENVASAMPAANSNISNDISLAQSINNEAGSSKESCGVGLGDNTSVDTIHSNAKTDTLLDQASSIEISSDAKGDVQSNLNVLDNPRGIPHDETESLTKDQHGMSTRMESCDGPEQVFSEANSLSEPCVKPGESANMNSATEIKRKRGRPKGSLNKKTLARLVSLHPSATQPAVNQNVDVTNKPGRRKAQKSKKTRLQKRHNTLKSSTATKPLLTSSENNGIGSKGTTDALQGKSSENNILDNDPPTIPGNNVDTENNNTAECKNQVVLRPCSVSLSLFTDRILKRVISSSENNGNESAVDGNAYPEIKRESEMMPSSDSAVSLPDHTMDTNLERVCVMGRKKFRKENSDSSPTVSTEKLSSSSGRKRRKPDKSEIRRKRRIPRIIGADMHSSEIPEKEIRLVTFTFPLTDTSETVIKTEANTFTGNGQASETPFDKGRQPNDGRGISVDTIRDDIAKQQTDAMSCSNEEADNSTDSTLNSDILDVRVKQEPRYEDISDEDTICDSEQMVATHFFLKESSDDNSKH